MTVYSPPGKNTGAAVIVFPGGGYKILAIDLEGTEICEWLASIGITGILLKYRVPYSGSYWDELCKCQKDPKASMALEDVERAVEFVRFHAKEWQIDPHKIGVIGFSAGGHLVDDVSNHFEKRPIWIVVSGSVIIAVIIEFSAFNPAVPDFIFNKMFFRLTVNI
jgi:dienelactone hydrolase